MYISEPSGSGKSAILTVAPTPSYPYSAPRGYSPSVDTTASIDDLLFEVENNRDLAAAKYGYSNPALDAYRNNLRYIKANPPARTVGGKQSGGNQGIGMEDILDAIFYASAIASIVPYAPLQIGGRVGVASTAIARGLYHGNKYETISGLNQLARESNRITRQYQSDSKRNPGKARIRRT